GRQDRFKTGHLADEPDAQDLGDRVREVDVLAGQGSAVGQVGRAGRGADAAGEGEGAPFADVGGQQRGGGRILGDARDHSGGRERGGRRPLFRTVRRIACA